MNFYNSVPSFAMTVPLNVKNMGIWNIVKNVLKLVKGALTNAGRPSNLIRYKLPIECEVD
jgi:hypothetical protein